MGERKIHFRAGPFRTGYFYLFEVHLLSLLAVVVLLCSFVAILAQESLLLAVLESPSRRLRLCAMGPHSGSSIVGKGKVMTGFKGKDIFNIDGKGKGRGASNICGIKGGSKTRAADFGGKPSDETVLPQPSTLGNMQPQPQPQPATPPGSLQPLDRYLIQQLLQQQRQQQQQFTELQQQFTELQQAHQRLRSEFAWTLRQLDTAIPLLPNDVEGSGSHHMPLQTMQQEHQRLRAEFNWTLRQLDMLIPLRPNEGSAGSGHLPTAP